MVAIGDYTDGKLGVARIGDDGRLTATSSAAAGGNAHMALDDGQSGGFVFVPCASAGHVAMFKLDLATGQLMPNSPATISAPGRPRHMAFNPNGKWAYVTHESRGALTTYAYDAATGLLSGPKDTTAPNDGAHVLAHPSGNFVFHIARGGGAVTVFKVGDPGVRGEPHHRRADLHRQWPGLGQLAVRGRRGVLRYRADSICQGSVLTSIA